MEQTTLPTRTVSANGAELAVHVRGEGTPLILCQPGLLDGSCYDDLVALLTDRFHVITYDARGHGQSTNPQGILDYDVLADDAAALIAALKLDRPIVGGWSDGGETALRLGLRHPGVARALIIGGTGSEMGGNETVKQGLREFFGAGTGSTPDLDVFAAHNRDWLLTYMQQLHTQYQDQWKDVVRLSAPMWIDYAGFSAQLAAQVITPCLVASGDRDGGARLESVIELYRWLPDAELAIIPGNDHMGPVFQPQVLATIIREFADRRAAD